MKNKNLFNNFTKQYQLSKTLRFELIPQGKTEKFIKEKGLVQKDETRAEDYKVAKKLIDEYHKDFIERALSDKKLSGLNDYLKEFTKPERDNKALSLLSESLREEIAELLKGNPTTDEKKLIGEKVPQFLKQRERDAEAEKVLKFKWFTTYFGGFNDNRKNIYSEKEQSTAIAYRIVHENLPKFISNMHTYQKLKDQIDFSEVETQMNKELNSNKLKDVFSLDYFNNCLTQSGINRYNVILGGKTDDKGKKTQGINEKINLFRQKNNLTGKQAPILAPLYKQILSDRTSASYLPENFKAANELTQSIRDYYDIEISKFEMNNEKKNMIDEIKNLFADKLNAVNCDLSQIYIRNAFVSTVSQQIFGSYSAITSALNTFIEKKYKTKKEKDKQQKKTYFSIEEIETALKAYLEETEIENKEKREEILKQANPILQYFNLLTTNIEIAKDKKEKTHIITYFRQKHESVQSVLNKEKGYEKNSELIQDKKAVAAIKDYLDSYLHILHFVKPLFVASPKKDESEIPDKDAAFYNEFDELFRQLNSVVQLYNKVRNFLTQKPYSDEKIKLNFENVSLLKGWDVNKETDNTSVILRGNGFYYLGIMDKNHNDILKKGKHPDLNKGEDFYEKMRYKLISGASKALPHAFLSGKGKKNFNPSPSLLEKYERGTHKKGNGFSLDDCHELINYFKDCLNKYYADEDFNFSFSPTDKYEDISGFYKEVDGQGYKISFEKIPATYIHQLISEGNLYLFKIYNKDFSPHSKGRPNLHTLYWKELFSEENLKDVVYKLNGEAEVFYRKKSITNKTIHRKGETINSKNPENPKQSSRFDYDIVKDKRYTEDKYHFHVPITLNFKSGEVFKFNDTVNQVLKDNPETNIIGIDRGERHLAYYSLINSKGEIIEQGSFNEIKNEYNGTPYKTDYQKSLTEKEKARDAARKSWDSIGKIKELKEGYVSQVVHKIARLMIKHNAIVALEDLNFGFKRGRMKVEKQVYQKLEKMLIDKLNYLVFKDHEALAPGGVLNAYQLAAPFTSFRDMGKQTGFIFYVPAANTSKIDFATGFVNFLYPKYENEKQAKEFFQKFDCIRFNPEKNYFEFVALYNNFIMDEKAKIENDREWTIWTHGKERWYYNIKSKSNKNEKHYLCADVTENLKELLKKQNIDFENGKDIKNSIIEKGSASFFSSFIWNLRLLLQMRYCYKGENGEEIDYILSPVYDEINKRFFDSREAKEAEPRDADANGAYHIALKGLLLLKRISGDKDVSKLNRNGKLDLSISNKEWCDFVQR